MAESTVGFAVDAFGERGSQHTLPLPPLGPSDARVRVEAAGVNPIDFKLRDGLDPSRPLPLVLGQDFAGTVEAAGAEAASLAGKRVFGISSRGAFARALIVPADGIIAEVPAGLSASEAAALPTPGLTALALVERMAQHGAHRALVVGPEGAVGRLVMQIAAVRGIEALGLGRGDDAAEVLQRSGIERIDAAVDTAGDAALLKALASMLRPNGYVVSTVFVADVEWFAARGIEAENLNAGTTPFFSGSGLKSLADLVARKEVMPHVDAVRPFAEAPEVLDGVKARTLRGKIVLAM